MLYRTLPVNCPEKLPAVFWTETPELLIVTWEEVTRVLGRPYAYTVEDDDALFAALRSAHAPKWVGYTNAYVEEGVGWILEKKPLR